LSGELVAEFRALTPGLAGSGLITLADRVLAGALPQRAGQS
jgi:hypothetical protein